MTARTQQHQPDQDGARARRPDRVPTLEAAIRSLEAHLGDPRDPASPMSHAAVIELDERGEYPHPFVSLLRRWGVQDWFVPAELDGNAVDVEDGGVLMRLVARRCITTATALSINAIGYTAIWTGGSPEQRRRLADRTRRGTRFAWALSEHNHGSDLLANETRARRVPEEQGGGWILDGEKWLIGNATMSDVVVVLARTRDKSGPASHSVFAVDRREVLAGQLTDLPNNPPVGLRGFDLSGLCFDACRVGEDALIGAEGRGVEIVLKTSQMVRVNLTYLALGALDTGLRLALEFARGREIFGDTVWQIPYSRSQLVESFADLLACDALSTGAVRALQLAPEQASSWSSIAKYLVPTVVDEAMTRCSVVLGARHFLRTGEWAIFQKMARDLIVADFADGNTVVNLKTVVAQLLGALSGRATVGEADRAAALQRVVSIFDLHHDLPSYEPSRQQLFTRRPDDVLLALPHTIEVLRERGGDWGAVAEAGEEVLSTCDRLQHRVDRIRAERGSGYAEAAETFAAAKEYCALTAAAGYLHLHAYGSDRIAPALRSAGLVRLVVIRMCRRGERPPPPPSADEVEQAALAMEKLADEQLLFSHRPTPLAGALDSPR